MMDVLPGVFMGMMGGAKFASSMARDRMEQWGYPRWWAYVTGALEVTGGALLASPRTRYAGAGVSGVVLAGAFATHIQHREYRFAMLPVATGLAVANAVWRQQAARRERRGWRERELDRAVDAVDAPLETVR